MSNAEVIQVLRGSVDDNHGYKPNFIRDGMIKQIRAEHPPRP